MFCLYVYVGTMRMFGAFKGQKRVLDPLAVKPYAGRCWQPNPDPLQKQQALLTKPSPAPKTCFYFFLMCWKNHTIEYYLTMRRETGHGTYHNKRMTNENVQIKEVRN